MTVALTIEWWDGTWLVIDDESNSLQRVTVRASWVPGATLATVRWSKRADTGRLAGRLRNAFPEGPRHGSLVRLLPP
jgi:hypothetical protein